MKRSPRPNFQNINRPLWILIGFLLLLAIVLAMGMKRETHSVWTQQTDKLTLSEYGELYALHDFYQKQFPNTPQYAWRYWQDGKPELKHQTQHLLFIENTRHLSSAQFQQLLNWIGQGNHVVMPLSVHAISHQDEVDTENIEELAQEAKRPESNHFIAEITQWAQISAAPEVDWKQKPAPKNPACDALAINITAAGQKLQPNLKANPQNNAVILHCQQRINTFTLPEGKTLHWLSDSDRGYIIKPAPHLLWQSESANGSHIARWQHGKGTLTLATSLQSFGIPTHPARLATDLNRLDHAFLASYLAQGKKQIWFIENVMPSGPKDATPLWKKMWAYSPYASLALLGLIALFIWRHAYREGNITPVNNHEQRQLSQFFQAQGAFLWKKSNQRQALSQLQQQLWQQWQKRIPQLNTMTKPHQLQALQKTYSVDEADLVLWLQPLPSTFTNKQWLNYLKAHQKLRNAL